MENLCIRCKGKGLCGKPCKILSKFIDFAPKVKKHFSGSTPPELFVGRSGYPNVFSGIISPNEKGETEIYSSPEDWVSQNLTIEQVLAFRGKLIYARQETNIKSQGIIQKKVQELALSSRPVSVEFFLKRPPRLEFTPSKVFSIMTNPAPIESINLEENPTVEKKVDYLTSDYDSSAQNALNELYNSNIRVSHLSKLLSAGLLGIKIQRKFVPTRWAITAVDDILSKNLAQKIKYYNEINEILLFSDEYNGNHYEFLLLPGNFSFEVIEAEAPGNVWNSSLKLEMTQDSEGFFGRKDYAKNVTGAYYANRLGVCEYLEKEKKQAQVIVLREIKEEYYAPLGVGILRELTRRALSKSPEKPKTVEEAFSLISSRTKIPAEEFKKNSSTLKEYGKQKKLNKWF
jgi:hypothetical protein